MHTFHIMRSARYSIGVCSIDYMNCEIVLMNLVPIVKLEKSAWDKTAFLLPRGIHGGWSCFWSVVRLDRPSLRSKGKKKRRKKKKISWYIKVFPFLVDFSLRVFFFWRTELDSFSNDAADVCDIDLETSLFKKQITSLIFNNGKFIDKDCSGIPDQQLQYYYSCTSEGQSDAL